MTRTSWVNLTARLRVAAMIVLGVAAALISGPLFGWIYAPLVGWDVAAFVFVMSVWVTIGTMTPEGTAAHVTRENPGRAASEVIVLLAAIASLGAIGVVVGRAHSEGGSGGNWLAVVAVLSVALSWFSVHTLFTLRYAKLYFDGKAGGVDFNQSSPPPRYLDFAYLAFTIGMTFQVSDTNLSTPSMRATALRHALLSYLFGAVILASMINLVVGLGSS
jgi:uncharacterized membrane protein